MILLDTPILVGGFAGYRPLSIQLERLLESDQEVMIPSIVIYEWLRGPRRPDEIALQQALFPAKKIVAFGAEEASLSADLYRSLRRARGREIDIAIAATAIVRSAELWTTNPKDFADIPGLRLAVLPR